MRDLLHQSAKGLHEQLAGWRHHLHRYPELSFEETETARYVADVLRGWGLSPREGVGGTGLTAEIHGAGNGPVIALRADMDALPIQEAESDKPYRSQRPGIMHACGHDVHTACLLGAARLLIQTREHWQGTVRLLFQPGEEKNPGGASLMIRDGALDNPRPQGIIGQHVMPFLPVGTVGFRSGQYMASADEIRLTVRGKGGHAALPDRLTDPVLIAAHLIVALQQVVSRQADPRVPSVLSFGRVMAGGATNVIPSEVYIEGTFRTMNEAWREQALQNIRHLSEQLCQSMGGNCEVNISRGYPFLVNEPALTARARQAACDYLGPEQVVDLDLWMASEDFAFYSHHVPACFYRLGTANEAKGIISPVHTPTFDIDEDALAIGAGLMAWITLQELSR